MTKATPQDVLDKLGAPLPEDPEAFDAWLDDLQKMANEADLSEGEPEEEKKNED